MIVYLVQCTYFLCRWETTIVYSTHTDMSLKPCYFPTSYIHKGKAVFWALGLDSIREYWVIYRGTGLPAVVWFGSMPTPFPIPSSVADQAYWQARGGGGGGRGAESYNHKIALPSIHHSILRGFKLSSPHWRIHFGLVWISASGAFLTDGIHTVAPPPWECLHAIFQISKTQSTACR